MALGAPQPVDAVTVEDGGPAQREGDERAAGGTPPPGGAATAPARALEASHDSAAGDRAADDARSVDSSSGSTAAASDVDAGNDTASTVVLDSVSDQPDGDPGPGAAAGDQAVAAPDADVVPAPAALEPAEPAGTADPAEHAAAEPVVRSSPNPVQIATDADVAAAPALREPGAVAVPEAGATAGPATETPHETASALPAVQPADAPADTPVDPGPVGTTETADSGGAVRPRVAAAVARAAGPRAHAPSVAGPDALRTVDPSEPAVGVDEPAVAAGADVDDDPVAEGPVVRGDDPGPDGAPAVAAVPDDEESEAAPVAEPGRGVPRLVTALLGLAALALAIAAVVLFLRLRSDHADDAAREQALSAARQSALNLSSISSATVARDIARVLDGSTGQFREDFAARTTELTSLLKDNDVSASGTVLDAGIERADRDSATALVVVDSTVKNKAVPDGRVNHYRMKVQVDKVKDQWLTSSLSFVG